MIIKYNEQHTHSSCYKINLPYKQNDVETDENHNNHACYY